MKRLPQPFTQNELFDRDFGKEIYVRTLIAYIEHKLWVILTGNQSSGQVIIYLSELQANVTWPEDILDEVIPAVLDHFQVNWRARLIGLGDGPALDIREKQPRS